MDVLFQRHAAKHIYVIPEGLRELMSDISREVLRSQPEQIYSFIADYLDALMITRENARVAARFVESMTEVGITIADLFVRTGMTRNEADAVATIIQIAFRKHLAEKTKSHKPEEETDEKRIIEQILEDANISIEQAEQAAIIIQNAYRHFKKREAEASDLLKGMVDWRVAARSTMRLYRKTGVTYEEANRAATLIKAAYKGYYTRRIMRRLLEESEAPSGAEMKTEQSIEYEYTYEHEQVEYEEQLSKVIDVTVSEGASEKGALEESNVGLYILNTLLQKVVPETPVESQASLTIPHPSLVDTVKVEQPPSEGTAATEASVSEATEGGEPASEAAVSEGGASEAAASEAAASDAAASEAAASDADAPPNGDQTDASTTTESITEDAPEA